VRFTVESPHPYPFNLCYCSICRKTQGGGGFSINLSARSDSLAVEGERYLRTYRARLPDGERSPARRHFCGECGSHLWLHDPRWPELVHPVAGAIDTPLPVPPHRVHLMLDSKAPWVRVHAEPSDELHAGVPHESIAEWHRRHDLESR
jgi:hypothetical protein